MSPLKYATEDSYRTIPVASMVIVVSAVLVLSCRQTHIHTHTHTTDERLTPATLVDISNEKPQVLILHDMCKIM